MGVNGNQTKHWHCYPSLPLSCISSQQTPKKSVLRITSRHNKLNEVFLAYGLFMLWDDEKTFVQ